MRRICALCGNAYGMDMYEEGHEVCRVCEAGKYCKCCGERRPMFMADDDTCFNCKAAAEKYGTCPHKGLT